MTFILLRPDNIHRDGDEMWMGGEWLPVASIHHGDPVGEDSPPCRRRVRLATLRAMLEIADAAVPGRRQTP